MLDLTAEMVHEGLIVRIDDVRRTARNHHNVDSIRVRKHLVQKRESPLEVANPGPLWRGEPDNDPFTVHSLTRG